MLSQLPPNNERSQREKESRREDEQIYRQLMEEGKPIPFTIEYQTWYITLAMSPDETADAAQKRLHEKLRTQLLQYVGDNETVFDFMREDYVAAFVMVDQGKKQAGFRVQLEDIRDENRDSVEALIDALTADDEILNLSAQYIHFGRASQASHWGGGGPGGWPFMPYWVIPDTTFNQAGGYHTFTLPQPPVGFPDQNYVSKLLQGGGTGVLIVLVDTAPTIVDWKAKADQLKATNPLIAKLKGAYDTNKFQIIPTLTTAQENILATLKAPAYKLVDHGIFVAGILHSIAPNAEIWLYRAVNDKGITYSNPVEDAIADLVKKLKNPHPYTHILINCSLTVADSMAEKYRADKSPLEERFFYMKEQIQGAQTKPVLYIGSSGNEATYKAVMQAGTEPTLPSTLVSNKVADAPPYPRFPAAFESTLGVTALNKRDMRASYANWADDFDWAAEQDSIVSTHPTLIPRQGIATYGGDIYEVPDPDPAAKNNRLFNLRLSDPFDSILGAYLSDYEVSIPEYKSENYVHQTIPNTKGWVYWSGTSFATPIVTAVLALMASHEPNLDENQLINKLIAYCGPARIRHTDNMGAKVNAEHLLKVRQGP